MISKRAFLHSAARAGMALLGAGLTASAQAESTYPSRPVRWVFLTRQAAPPMCFPV